MGPSQFEAGFERDEPGMHSRCTAATRPATGRWLMQVISTWTGRHASALRQALRETNEGFAARLGIAVRTVAKWNAQPTMVLSPAMQQDLDTVYGGAPADALARFRALLASSRDPAQADTSGQVNSAQDTDGSDIESALAWLAHISGWSLGKLHDRMHGLTVSTELAESRAQGHRRALVPQRDLADALINYYDCGEGPYFPYEAQCGGALVRTSLLTQASWLDMALPMGAGRDEWELIPTPVVIAPDGAAVEAALRRLVEVYAAGARLVNTPIYRLLHLHIHADGLSGAVSAADFLSYALTVDLLEGELLDRIVAGTGVHPGSLPLRGLYLPNVSAATSPETRICAGGVLALTAIARPRTRHTEADYVILVQRRSSRVLNAAGRLAVIPKAFHEPLVDHAHEAHVLRTVLREMEEELFGRDEVDAAVHEQRTADPMRRDLLSDPLRWLTDPARSSSWSVEYTGIGFNLISGNYELASLVVIEDEEWWDRFGGTVVANWESSSLRTYSTRNRAVIEDLIRDPTWSNEGLFALLQGIRRLSELGGARVGLPVVEWECQRSGR